jgi:tRNA pseudouridine38-40 synthase
MDVERLPLAVITHLPKDFAVTAAKIVDDSFHARYSAKGKEYVYLIWKQPYAQSLLFDTALHYPKYIDCGKAAEIARDFVGRHDFASFMAVTARLRIPSGGLVL